MRNFFETVLFFRMLNCVWNDVTLDVFSFEQYRRSGVTVKRKQNQADQIAKLRQFKLRFVLPYFYDINLFFPECASSKFTCNLGYNRITKQHLCFMFVLKVLNRFALRMKSFVVILILVWKMTYNMNFILALLFSVNYFPLKGFERTIQKP